MSTKAPPLPPVGPSSSLSQPLREDCLASQQSSSRRTPTQTDGPPPIPVSQAQAQDQSSALSLHLAPGGGSWKGEYGLPAGPRSGGAGRTTSPLPTQIGRRSPRTRRCLASLCLHQHRLLVLSPPRVQAELTCIHDTGSHRIPLE